jgi:hypothetical protein
LGESGFFELHEQEPAGGDEREEGKEGEDGQRGAKAVDAGVSFGLADVAADRALRLATAAGLPLILIDALETVAVIAVAGGDHIEAARLLGATTAERQRRGYFGRLTPATQSLVDQFASTQTSAWNAGAALSLEQVMTM